MFVRKRKAAYDLNLIFFIVHSITIEEQQVLKAIRTQLPYQFTVADALQKPNIRSDLTMFTNIHQIG